VLGFLFAPFPSFQKIVIVLRHREVTRPFFFTSPPAPPPLSNDRADISLVAVPPSHLARTLHHRDDVFRPCFSVTHLDSLPFPPFPMILLVITAILLDPPPSPGRQAFLYEVPLNLPGSAAWSPLSIYAFLQTSLRGIASASAPRPGF